MLDRERIKKILVISLSNIGDAVLTTPVIQTLRENFPQARVDVLVGPRALAVFKSDHRIEQKIIYDKTTSWKNKLALMQRLRHDRYDLIVDLRKSAFGIFLGARYRTAIFAQPPKALTHMKDRHLWRLESLGLTVDYAQGPSVICSEDDRMYIRQLLNKWQINDEQMNIALAPGARNMTKRWEKTGFIRLIDRLDAQYQARIILVGDKQDAPIAEEIAAQAGAKLFNLCGKTTIGQLCALLAKCRLLISGDSAPMHLGWAVKIPVVAIFGPTDEKKYAPQGQTNAVIRKELACSPCELSLCPTKTRRCMKLVTADEVFAACKRILNLETSDRRESRAKARENQITETRN